MFELRPTDPFYEDLKKFQKPLYELVWKKLSLFQQNPAHPSLRVHAMDGHAGIFELSVTKKYRVTFQWEKKESGRLAVLRRAGPHDILRTP